MTPEIAKRAAKGIVAGALLIAAISWLFIFAISAAVTPTGDELLEVDRLVMQRIERDRIGCAVERLSSPERIQESGDVKKGYFTYSVRCGGDVRKARADWIIQNGRVEVTSLTLR